MHAININIKYWQRNLKTHNHLNIKLQWQFAIFLYNIVIINIRQDYPWPFFFFKFPTNVCKNLRNTDWDKTKKINMKCPLFPKKIKMSSKTLVVHQGMKVKRSHGNHVNNTHENCLYIHSVLSVAVWRHSD